MRLFSHLCLCAAASLFCGTGWAHGGSYRGPGDVAPPNAGGSSGGSVSPSTPRNSGGWDATTWEYWWGFNKAPMVRLKEAIHKPVTVTGSADFFMGASRRVRSADFSTRPTEEDVQTIVLPALKRALDRSQNRDIVGACVVALAKIGRDHKSFEILPIFARQLATFDQEIRETAALAMGISQKPEAVDGYLKHLVLDDAEGRRLMQKAGVDGRTRTFATYAMGLIAWANPDRTLKRTVLETVTRILRDDSIVDRNIRVAAINTLALLRPAADETSAADPNSVLNRALDELDHFQQKKLGRGEELIQAHVPPAVAKLLGRGNTKRHRRYKELYHQLLSGDEPRSNDIYRSAALALGQLALSTEVVAGDGKYSDTLWTYFGKGKDQQARYFCLIAMGQIGGNANRNRLMTLLRRGKKALERPWAALALGVQAFNALERDESATVDVTLGEALLKNFKDIKTPEARSAFALAMGLARYRDAGVELLNELSDRQHQDRLASYICMGLGLMGYQKARPLLHHIAGASLRRPGLLSQAAIALGKLGDRKITDDLSKQLQDATSLSKLVAIAGALNLIGDRRTLPGLVKILEKDDLTDLTRAFAAMALGGACDKENLPWNTKIALNMNYRAVVETLTQSGRGVLDIM